MTDVLKLVLTDHWFEEIKSGRKTHEYRLCNAYWRSRIYHIWAIIIWHVLMFIIYDLTH